uniref:MLX interacting protein like n=1 Tax=Podarcis muralis TaxID=64176 RepID=A0A670IY53_PODMU
MRQTLFPCCYGSLRQGSCWEEVESAFSFTAREAARPLPGRMSRPQIIHSGHFMVSEPHADPDPEAAGGKADDGAHIDPSLTKLFKCMTLAYSEKLVSPKWKTFKGLKLLQRDKIRLNNAIWRAWYLQYVEKRQNPVCSFVTPLECSDVDVHRKPEAVIMEGKYWKRQVGVVIREYHKWRLFSYTQVSAGTDASKGWRELLKYLHVRASPLLVNQRTIAM